VCEVVSVKEDVAVCGTIDFQFAVKNSQKEKETIVSLSVDRMTSLNRGIHYTVGVT